MKNTYTPVKRTAKQRLTGCDDRVEWLFWLFLAFCLIAQPSFAATWCVDTATKLQSALTIAGSNSDHDHIKIVQGTYNTPGQIFSHFSRQAYLLILEGGYTANCADRTLDPRNTILDGNNSNQVLSIFIDTPGNPGTQIEGLTIRNGKTTGLLEKGAGLRVNGTGGFDGSVTLLYNIFHSNSASTALGSAFSVATSGNIDIINNLVYENSSAEYVATITGNGSNTNLINNTVAENYSFFTEGGFFTTGQSHLVAFNNIFWNNQGDDLFMNHTTNWLLNNNIQELDGTPGPSSANNLSLDPKFFSITNYRLRTDSPLIDKGSNAAVNYVNQDLEGKPRVAEQVIDIGAYEQSESQFFVLPGKHKKTVIINL